MRDLKTKLVSIRNKVAQVNPELADNINNMVHTIDYGSPAIEKFAKPRANVSVVEDNGTIHSFAVEIKSSKDGPIPDTQLMSKILQAIESHNGDGMTEEYAAGGPNQFEVVSFKYERRDDKKK